jgi:hypothetical protein
MEGIVETEVECIDSVSGSVWVHFACCQCLEVSGRMRVCACSVDLLAALAGMDGCCGKVHPDRLPLLDGLQRTRALTGNIASD